MLLLTAVLVGIGPTGARAADTEGPIDSSDRRTDDSISRAVAWLYTQQADGHWETNPLRDSDAKDWRVEGGQWGGRTALVVAALLSAGQSHQDPRLTPAIDFLTHAEIVGTYALAMRCQVLSRLPQTDSVRPLLVADAKRLMATAVRAGEGLGFHSYTAGSTDYSHSRGNYAALGLWAAAEQGIDVPDAYWRQVQAGWIRHQLPDGGWTYKAESDTEHPATVGMTAAGVATLYITSDRLTTGSADCRPVGELPAIDRGLKWLEQHPEGFAPSQRGERGWPFPTLYALERVAVAGGVRTIGGRDWFADGATWLRDRQRKDGSWTDASRGPGDVIDTAMGLLFLARGRAPVAFAKLRNAPPTSAARATTPGGPPGKIARFGGPAIAPDLSADSSDQVAGESPVTPKATPADIAGSPQATPTSSGLPPDPTPKVIRRGIPGDFGESAVAKPTHLQQQYPRDIASLTRWLGRQTESELSWVGIGVDELGQTPITAPVLYISGSTAVTFTAAEQIAIRRYIEDGGLLLASADCGRASFAESIRKLLTGIYPQYRLRDLPPTSPLYASFPRSKWKTKPAVLAMSNGVRELAVLIPQADPGRAWQSSDTQRHRELFELAGNVWLYATGRQPMAPVAASWADRSPNQTALETGPGETTLSTVPFDPSSVPDASSSADAEPTDAFAPLPAAAAAGLPTDLANGESADSPISPIEVGRLKYPGNWDPEPAGWRYLSGVMVSGTRAAVHTVPIDLDESIPPGLRLIHLTGTDAVTLPGPVIEELRRWLDAGGTLLVDAAGGSAAFADGIEPILTTLGGTESQILPADDPLFCDEKGNALPIGYRDAARGLLGELSAPRIRVWPRDGKGRIVFSREDLTAGLAGVHSDGILGYDPATARLIVGNVVTEAVDTARRSPGSRSPD